MIDPALLLQKAEHSSFARLMLNIGLKRMIPFNSPHRFKITSVTSDSISITAPYIRRNKNHVNGIHACALATLCEYSCGLALARTFDPNTYRVILKELKVNYHYQAKEDVTANYHLPLSTISDIQKTLSKEDAALCTLIVDINDSKGNVICIGEVTWQVKPWSKAKTSK